MRRFEPWRALKLLQSITPSLHAMPACPRPARSGIINLMAVNQNFIRRGIHHFVYGLCAVVIGITPPTEKQEVPFFFILLGFFLFVTVGVFLFAVYVIPAFK